MAERELREIDATLLPLNGDTLSHVAVFVIVQLTLLDNETELVLPDADAKNMGPAAKSI